MPDTAEPGLDLPCKRCGHDLDHHREPTDTEVGYPCTYSAPFRCGCPFFVGGVSRG